jgi:hypothetical protein
MGKMKELAIDRRNSENFRLVQNLAEATLRLATEVDRIKTDHVLPDASLTGLNYALSDAKGEARDMLKLLKVS